MNKWVCNILNLEEEVTSTTITGKIAFLKLHISTEIR